MTIAHIPTYLSDDELIADVARLAGREREATAELVAHLAELDRRRLYLGAGFSSLFAYCCGALRLSEHEAYNRIEAARAARQFPLLLDHLSAGAVNLTTVRLVAPHLTEANHRELLTAAAHRCKREVEELIASRFPRPSIGALVRRLPAPSAAPPVPAARPAGPGSTLPSPEPAPAPLPVPGSRRPLVAPLGSDRYVIRFTASAATHNKLRLAQDLLRHVVPTGDPADIVDRALTLLLEDLGRKKFAAARVPTASPPTTAPGSRHIPARVKRAVWLRDGGRCAFVARSGRRCTARGFLEFHHVKPHGVGGEATPENIALRCRAHNGYEADLYYGRLATDRTRARAGGPTRSGTSRPERAPGDGPAQPMPMT